MRLKSLKVSKIISTWRDKAFVGNRQCSTTVWSRRTLTYKAFFDCVTCCRAPKKCIDASLVTQQVFFLYFRAPSQAIGPFPRLKNNKSKFRLRSKKWLMSWKSSKQLIRQKSSASSHVAQLKVLQLSWIFQTSHLSLIIIALCANTRARLILLSHRISCGHTLKSKKQISCSFCYEYDFFFISYQFSKTWYWVILSRK